MFSNRTIRFLAVGTLIAIAFITILTMLSSPRPVIARPGPEAIEQGLVVYFQSERANYATLDTEIGLEKYHRSEWGLSERPLNKSQDTGLAIYFQSERSLFSPPDKEMGLAQYHRSEWGLDERMIDEPQDAGMAIYLASERSIPLRDVSAFNPYQRSEWFGQ